MDPLSFDLPHLHPYEHMDEEFHMTWMQLDTEMTQCSYEGILDLGLERPLVSYIPAPTPNSAVAEAVYRWRIECAIRGIDTDFQRL